MLGRIAWLPLVGLVACSGEPPLEMAPDAGRRCLPTRGCGDDDKDAGSAAGTDAGVGEADAATLDADVTPDAGSLDSGPRDAGTPDAGPRDAGFPCPIPSGGWTPLATGLEANGSPSTPINALTVAADGLTPIVAWTEGTPAVVHVRRFDGTSFVNFGGPFDDQPGNSLAYDPRLAVSGGDVVLMHGEFDSTAPSNIFVRRWNGQAWSRLGGTDFDGLGIAFGTDLTVDTNGRVIAALAIGNPRRIDIRSIEANGTTAITPTLGVGAGAMLGATAPVLGEDASGALVAAFTENGVRTFVRGMSTWDQLGPALINQNGGLSTAPRLARFGAPRAPVLAFSEPDGAGGSNVYVYRFGGGAWNRIGDDTGRLVTPGPVNLRAVEEDSMGRIVVALTVGDFNSQRLFVVRSDGAAFTDLGSMPLSAFGAVAAIGDARMVLDRCARPIVAFTEAATNADRSAQIYRFDGP